MENENEVVKDIELMTKGLGGEIEDQNTEEPDASEELSGENQEGEKTSEEDSSNEEPEEKTGEEEIETKGEEETVEEEEEETVEEDKDKVIENLRKQLEESQARTEPKSTEEPKPDPEPEPSAEPEPPKLEVQDFLGDLDLDELTRSPLSDVLESLLVGLVIENLQLFAELFHEFDILLAGFLC